MSDNWVFPLGHHLGAFYTGDDDAPAYHRIRIGSDVVDLSNDLAQVWNLARGLPGAVLPGSGRTWTRAMVVDLARAQGDEEPEGAVADLVDAGALVEVADVALFARGHRLQPLLAGLGVTAERPDRYGIGLLDQPVATVDEVTFDMWQWSPRVADLWELSEVQALAAQMLGDEADDGLGHLLERLHLLLAYGCGYLDIAVVPVVAPPASAASGATSPVATST